MPKKRFSAEQIVTLLRQIEVSMGQGSGKPQQGVKFARVLFAHALHFVGFEQFEAVGLGAMGLVAPDAGVDPVADPALGLGSRHGGRELRH
jgi:hypothetical protein